MTTEGGVLVIYTMRSQKIVELDHSYIEGQVTFVTLTLTHFRYPFHTSINEVLNYFTTFISSSSLKPHLHSKNYKILTLFVEIK